MAGRGQGTAHIGAACEMLVAADLLKRNLETTKPLVDNGDDFHVRLSTGWASVQVKARDRSMNCWRPSSGRRSTITSSLLALVDIDTGEIRYQLRGNVVPKELQ